MVFGCSLLVPTLPGTKVGHAHLSSSLLSLHARSVWLHTASPQRLVLRVSHDASLRLVSIHWHNPKVIKFGGFKYVQCTDNFLSFFFFFFTCTQDFSCKLQNYLPAYKTLLLGCPVDTWNFIYSVLWTPVFPSQTCFYLCIHSLSWWTPTCQTASQVFFSHPMFNLLANPIGSIFQAHSDSNTSHCLHCPALI